MTTFIITTPKPTTAHMIESEQLMKGDYVQFTDNHKIVHIARVKQTMEFTCLVAYRNNTGEYDELVVEYKKLSPILLDDDTLRYIGFSPIESDPYFFIQPNHEKCYRWVDMAEQYDFTVDVGNTEGNYHITILQRGKIAMNMLYKEIPVLHDLQHALKVCHVPREVSMMSI